MLTPFLIPFLTILVAEFLDKSQLSILLLATRTHKHLQLLVGVMLAFVLVDGIAILAGAWITLLISPQIIKLLSGLAFIIFGVLSFRTGKEATEKTQKVSNAFVSGFTITFLAEWGDKTQLAAAVFATRYHPIPVFLGVITALFLLSVLAVFVSKALMKKVERTVIAKIAGVVFIILGVLFFLQ